MSREHNSFFRTYGSLIKILVLMTVIIAVTYISGIGCPIKFFTGISCPGCGMTRAVSCCAKFQFTDALYYHPLVVLLLPGAIMFFFWKRIPVKVRNILGIIIIIIFFAVYFLRLFAIPGDIVTVDFKDGLLFKLFNNIIKAI
ncbi:MAG: DUF2752 domain-containing protein [Lachnospiraceae bacterium]|nr:DUF2752 domain-containing protein [Lachnospiraceae bacterium]